MKTKENLCCEVMDDYIRIAEHGHLAIDESRHKEEMREQFNKLWDFISQTRQADVDNIIQWINENFQGVVSDMIIKHLKTLKENI